MRVLTIPLATGILLLLSSCDAVLTESPISDRTSPLLQEQLTGIWQHEDGTIHVAFDSNGSGHTASLDWSKNKFKLEQGELHAAEIGGEKFFSFKPIVQDPDDDPKGYILAHFQFAGDDELQIFSPDVEAFENKVKSGDLEGKVDKGKYSTRIFAEDVSAILEEPDAAIKLFSREESLLLRRLSEDNKVTNE
tara:strand:+ start:946 stop:1521 length:576 start_codon:yes stop_codon:yes gene_type:complete